MNKSWWWSCVSPIGVFDEWHREFLYENPVPRDQLVGLNTQCFRVETLVYEYVKQYDAYDGLKPATFAYAKILPYWTWVDGYRI